MKPKDFLIALRNVINAYLECDSEVIVSNTISVETLDDFDFIDLLIRMLNNYKVRNYEKRDSH